MKLTRKCSFVTRTFLSIRGWSFGFGSQFFLKDSRSWLNTACWCWPSDLLCTFDVVLKWKIHEDLLEQAFVDRKQGSFTKSQAFNFCRQGYQWELALAVAPLHMWDTIAANRLLEACAEAGHEAFL